MPAAARITIHKTVLCKAWNYINNYSSSNILYPSYPNTFSENDPCVRE